MNILGIDPGIANTGYALVDFSKDDPVLRDHGCVRTSPKLEFGDRLRIIYTQLELLIDKTDILCAESVFFARNTTSAFGVAKVIGLVQLIAARKHRQFIEVRPAEAKASINLVLKCGKQEVMDTVNQIFGTHIQNEHTADSIAIAIAGSKKLAHPTIFTRNATVLQ